MWKLSIDDDQAQRSVVPLSRTEYQIGRADENQVRLTERNVSRHHARIRLAGNAWMLEDLGSYNGVFVNGTRIAGACELSAGDAIAVGDFVLQLHSEQTVLSTGFAAGGEAPAVDRLVLLSGPRAGSEFPVGDDIQLGSDATCSAHLPYPGVRGKHATLHRVEGARFELIDHAGDGSTQVNGVALPRALLTTGDEVLIGQARLQLVAAGTRYTVPAPAPVPVAVEAQPAASPTPAPVRAIPDPEVEESPEPLALPTKKKSGLGGLLLAALVAGGVGIAAFVALSGEEPEAAAPALQATANDENEADAPDATKNAEAQAEAERVAAAKAEQEATDAQARAAAELAASEEKEAAEAAAFVAAEEAALNKAQDEAAALAAAKTQARALVEPARGEEPSRRSAPRSKAKKRKKKLSGGIQRSNPFQSTRDLATSGDPTQMREAKRRLLSKARSNNASAAELKTLRALCGQLKDFACRKEASALLAKKQSTR